MFFRLREHFRRVRLSPQKTTARPSAKRIRQQSYYGIRQMNLLNPRRQSTAWISGLSIWLGIGVLTAAAQNSFVVKNLVSDLPGFATIQDTNLLNPWGIATSPTGPFWVSDNHAGLSTIYNSTGGVQSLVVTIPPPTGGTPPAAPTGLIFNGTHDFQVASNKPAVFIFATEDGTISGWASGAGAVLKVDESATAAVYKGLAMGSWGGTNYLYAANFYASTVDVFDAKYQSVPWTGAFADAGIPSGFAPFGIQNLGGLLYVTYAKQNDQQHDDVAGPGNGYVNVFTPNGQLVKRFASNGALNSPWGIAIAPASFGDVAGTILIGNFGDGHINAFDPITGALRGTLKDASGATVGVQGLWGLIVGNGGKGGDTNTLYFTAGIPGPGGHLEDHGLFGSISPSAPFISFAANRYQQANLVSDIPNTALHTDTNLLNPWGIATSSGSPFWVSDNHTGLSTIYDSTGGVQSLVVSIPGPAGSTNPGAPTGIIFNATTNFTIPTGTSNSPAKFIFATEDGTIAAWAGGATALIKADRSATGAVYKGLGYGSWGGDDYLYAANFNAGTVDVYDKNYTLQNWTGAFSDPSIPDGFAPFNVQNFGGVLYVTYAKQDDAKHDDVSGDGNGYINIFTTGGQWVSRFVTQGPLNSPWGLAAAPPNFGVFGGALLVGNFGNGWINAFNPINGAYLGALHDDADQIVAIRGMWGLRFGNGAKGGDASKLYFAAGIPGDGVVEDHGLFGSFTAIAVPHFTGATVGADGLNLQWMGGIPPYHLQIKTNLASPAWADLTTTTNTSATIPATSDAAFVRFTAD
jgi:uncharacterized protein (TIGR03118 family)